MRFVIAAVLVLVASPVAASSTMCVFQSPPEAPVPDLEFLGYEEPAGILIAGKHGPRSLPTSSYVLELDQHASRIHLTYTNPGDPSLPPSFTVDGKDRHAQLTVRENTYIGELACGQW